MKWWAKSKTIIANILLAIFSTLSIIVDSLNHLLTDNLDYLKGVLNSKYIFILLLLSAIFNIYTRLTVNSTLVKKSTIKRIKKEKEKKDDLDKKLP